MKSAAIEIQKVHVDRLSDIGVTISAAADIKRAKPYIVIGSFSSTFTGAQDIDGENVLATVSIFADTQRQAKELQSEVTLRLHKWRPQLDGFVVADARFAGATLTSLPDEEGAAFLLSVDFSYIVYNT